MGIFFALRTGPFLRTRSKKEKKKAECRLNILCIQGLYSPTILKNVLSLVLQIFLYLDAFECSTTLIG